MDMNPVEKKSRLTPREGVPLRTELDPLITKIKGDISAHNEELNYRNADPMPGSGPKTPNYYPADRAGHPVKKFDVNQNIGGNDPHTPTKE